MIRRLLIALIMACVVTGVHAQEDTGIRFKDKDLVGTWEYLDAYVELPNGTITRNFGDRPRGLFIIQRNGWYSHIVLADDLPTIASGLFKVMTDAEAQAVATNVLPHFGTWDAEEKKGRFTVHIQKSSFANFDGLDQVRVVLALDRNTLRYRNLLVTNGPGAAVVAVLRRIPDHPRQSHRPR